ncbi:zinc finger protein 28 [Trichonephila clavata]|uniref:Zinc finger protein 28 n=1 Tax=Trichonephila clavata TaxID=2740835 RepID=A0A8X6F604_TRICU|nr:zinc finger protein 28 [Trichonephila clavata]
MEMKKKTFESFKKVKMFLESQVFPENKMVDEQISRAIDNDHTAAMKASSENKKLSKKSSPDMITVCMLCQKAFKNHMFYRKHLRLHSDKAAHHCHICGKNFLRKHQLQSHLQTHAKRQYQCPYCHKRFSQKKNLTRHLKFHAAKKIYKCTICEKDFFQQQHLKAHLRHHNNERPFECELCHKSFNIKSSLQRHMNCHTGEKPFICDICNRGYTRRSVLMLHIQQVHENKRPFQCDECQLCFSQKGNLQAHYRRKHLQPKSEGKRGKDKDGKMKRSIKRSHSRSKTVKICSNKNLTQHMIHSDEPSKSKLNKSRIDNTSLHSYASKVKAIVNRGTRAQVSENQRIVNKYSKSAFPENGKYKEQTKDQPALYNSPSSQDSSSSSSYSLSDEAVDVGCSSSSGEDIPELNFPTILDAHADIPYDIKTLSDFETLLDCNKEWEDYLISDANEMLSSSLPHYELNDVFTSPSKSNILLPRSTNYTSDEMFASLSWTDDCAANPLFTADEIDQIKDLTGMCGPNSLQASVDGIKVELFDQDKRYRSSQNSRNVNHVNFSMHKTH